MADEEKNVSENLWTPILPREIPPMTLKIVNAIIDRIPELPLSVQKVIELSSNEESKLEDIVNVIASDPALVSSILKVVNSSYYGLSHKTDNLHLAIVLLGFKEVKKIAIKSFMSRNLYKDKALETYDTRNLWEHSYLVSICAESFVKEDKSQKRGIFLTLGLLHDIGKFALYDIALLFKKMDIKPKALKTITDSTCILEKEEKLFGINHSIIGGMLAKKWNLSGRIISVLECHHHPSFYGVKEVPPEFEEEISAICIADLVVNKFKEEKNPLPEPHQHFFNVLGLTPPVDNILTDSMRQKIGKALEFVEIL